MTQIHSPWPLFCDDLDFAQDWMRDQLNRFPMTGEAGHTALNIGLRDEVQEHLACHPKDDRVTNKAVMTNSIPSCSPGWSNKPLQRTNPQLSPRQCLPVCCKAAQNKTPLAVHLFGGLGDQLNYLASCCLGAIATGFH